LKLLRDQLNRVLPSDIAVLAVEEADANFHARHDAVRRYYLYQVASRKTAFSKRFAWWVKEPLNVAAIQQGLKLLLGRHDFAAFGEKRGEKKSTIVEVYECSLNVAGELILIRIGASHFLWKMVRRLVGSLVEIGRGNVTLDVLGQMLTSRQGSAAPWTAPASGLFLEKVSYTDDECPGELHPVLWV
jgi:tRNA pseudouridine38-40 synthase